MQKYIDLLPRFLRTRNDKGKEYKTLFQTFVGWQIIRYDENWPVKIQSVGLAVRLETIRRQAKTDIILGLPSFSINRMRHNIRVFAITFPFLVPPHLFHCFFG
jgi:hypothetical protein